jgi:hypothetical protein
VLVTCSPATGYQLAFIDPRTGQTTLTRDFPLTEGAQASAGCGADPDSAQVRGPHQDLRNAFDASYSRIAVSLPGADNGSDVGYETAGGTLTDVTAQQGATGDFSAAPDDTLPSFRPGTAELWFDHSGKVVSVVAGGNLKAYVRHPSVHVYGGQSAPADLGVDAAGDRYLPSFVPVDPAGPKWVGYLENDDGLQALPCASAGRCISDGYGIYPPGGIDGGNFDIRKPLARYPFKASDPGDGCEPWAWITQTSWLCFDQGQGSGIGVASVSHGGLLTVRFPIPDVSGRVNYDPVLSPDRAQIAFQSCRAGACDIYTVPAGGGAQPVKVSSVEPGQDTALIEWLS